MCKRYRKMAKKANGKIREIRDGQVILEMPLPAVHRQEQYEERYI